MGAGTAWARAPHTGYAKVKFLCLHIVYYPIGGENNYFLDPGTPKKATETVPQGFYIKKAIF